MKTTRTILAASVLALAGAAGALGSGSLVTDGVGSATITVYHSVTGDALARMPVTVLRVVKPETVAPIYWTGRNGSVTIMNLPEGIYNAFVSYNNHTSDVVRFEIIGDYHPFVSVYFNPDIDN